jgi:hypothetical protein
MSENFEIVTGLLSPEEAAELESYLLGSVLPEASTHDGVKTAELKNRPDTWDPQGYIEKGREVSDNYFRSGASKGMLIPTGYFVRQLQAGQEILPVLDIDNSPDAKVHDVYRKIALVSLSQDYEGGKHFFPELGQSVLLGAGDAIFYEISPETTTGISEILAGSKIDLIYSYSELKLNVRFDDFEMQKMENRLDRF